MNCLLHYVIKMKTQLRKKYVIYRQPFRKRITMNEPEGWEVGQWLMNELLPTIHIRMYQRCSVIMASRIPLQSEVIAEQDQQRLVLSMLDKPAVDQYLEHAGIHDT